MLCAHQARIPDHRRRCADERDALFKIVAVFLRQAGSASTACEQTVLGAFRPTAHPIAQAARSEARTAPARRASGKEVPARFGHLDDGASELCQSAFTGIAVGVVGAPGEARAAPEAESEGGGDDRN